MNIDVDYGFYYAVLIDTIGRTYKYKKDDVIKLMEICNAIWIEGGRDSVIQFLDMFAPDISDCAPLVKYERGVGFVFVDEFFDVNYMIGLYNIAKLVEATNYSCVDNNDHLLLELFEPSSLDKVLKCELVEMSEYQTEVNIFIDCTFNYNGHQYRIKRFAPQTRNSAKVMKTHPLNRTIYSEPHEQPQDIILEDRLYNFGGCLFPKIYKSKSVLADILTDESFDKSVRDCRNWVNSVKVSSGDDKNYKEVNHAKTSRNGISLDSNNIEAYASIVTVVSDKQEREKLLKFFSFESSFMRRAYNLAYDMIVDGIVPLVTYLGNDFNFPTFNEMSAIEYFAGDYLYNENTWRPDFTKEKVFEMHDRHRDVLLNYLKRNNFSKDIIDKFNLPHPMSKDFDDRLIELNSSSIYNSISYRRDLCASIRECYSEGILTAMEFSLRLAYKDYILLVAPNAQNDHESLVEYILNPFENHKEESFYDYVLDLLSAGPVTDQQFRPKVAATKFVNYVMKLSRMTVCEFADSVMLPI